MTFQVHQSEELATRPVATGTPSPRERPILFSAPMVRALLAGTKTQTRRICKPAQDAGLSYVTGIEDPRERGQRPLEVPGSGWFGDEEGDLQFFCPYGARGDRLWVRETWSTHACFDDVPPAQLTTRSLHYWADGEVATGKGRPSIHMPRWASRTLLEVTEVRVERLQDISEEDCIAEGVIVKHREWNSPAFANPATPEIYVPTARDAYRQLWESINGAGSWSVNPWVWAISFSRIKR